MNSNESSMIRPRPPTPYEPSGRVTRATIGHLAATLEFLRGNPKTESCCLWLGRFDGDGHSTVELIVIPKQVCNSRNYSVPPHAMQEVAAIARPEGLTVVGAIHSHPGISVEHSAYDDHMTPSRKAVSIVVPYYGNWIDPWPHGIGVHEYVGNYWHLLSPFYARQRIQFSGSHLVSKVDLR